MKDFTIDRVSWHTRLDSDPAYQERVQKRFKTIAGFLQAHGLVKGSLLPDGAVLDDNFEIFMIVSAAAVGL